MQIASPQTSRGTTVYEKMEINKSAFIVSNYIYHSHQRLSLWLSERENIQR